jgi:hypothetical protein
MSGTSEKIESISDAGAFETLGIRVLREIDQDCRAIIHLGQNVVGKPIPGPVDGKKGQLDTSCCRGSPFSAVRFVELEPRKMGLSREFGLKLTQESLRLRLAGGEKGIRTPGAVSSTANYHPLP